VGSFWMKPTVSLNSTSWLPDRRTCGRGVDEWVGEWVGEWWMSGRASGWASGWTGGQASGRGGWTGGWVGCQKEGHVNW
jgi:hypothetical protein